MAALYGIKFIAAVGIFLHHLSFPYSTGRLFTTFFFIFAGFITAYSFEKKKFVCNKKTLKDFYISKLVKNYPIYLATLLICIPLVEPVEVMTIGLKDLVMHSLMLQVMVPYGAEIFMFNGLSWFLADLMIFYFVIPFIYHLLQKFKINKSGGKLCIGIAIMFLACLILAFVFPRGVTAYRTSWWLLYISPFTRIIPYLLGFFLGLWFVLYQGRLKKAALRIPKWGFTIIEFMSVLCIPVSILVEKRILNFELNEIAYTITAFFMILVFALERGYLSKLLSTKVLVYLGKMSFVIYMLHQVIINYISLYLGVRPWYNTEISKFNNLMTAFLLFIITLSVCDVTNRYIITPFTKWLQEKVKVKTCKS